MQINKYIMLTIFFVPLTMIAVWETFVDKPQNKWMIGWMSSAAGGVDDETNIDYQNPQVEDEDGLIISKVPFEDLVKHFPNLHLVRRVYTLTFTEY